MSKTYYVCKYTPVELLRALGGDCEILNEMPESFDEAEQVHILISVDLANRFWKKYWREILKTGTCKLLRYNS